MSELSRQGDIPPELIPSLRNVLNLANRAIHGEFVRQQDAEVLANLGIGLLQELRILYGMKITKPIDSKIIDSD